jgi:hypothetical protein
MENLKSVWREAGRDTLAMMRGKDPWIWTILCVSVVLNLLQPGEYPEEGGSSRVTLWIVELLLLLTAQLLLLILLVMRVAKGRQLTPASAAKQAGALFVPLFILYLRGSILTLFGALILIIPGLYFYFKYTLAAVGLVLEGWREPGPIERAGSLIKKHRWSLLPLALLICSEGVLELGAAGAGFLLGDSLVVRFTTSVLFGVYSVGVTTFTVLAYRRLTS